MALIRVCAVCHREATHKTYFGGVWCCDQHVGVIDFSVAYLLWKDYLYSQIMPDPRAMNAMWN
jgi:hypothetical protein